MNNSLKNLKYDILKLYNKIVFLSRNKFLYNIFYIDDTFQNRINLIFIHISFLFIKVKKNRNIEDYKEFSQKMFDFIFKKIEINMRELGYGDVSVNKNMKFLVKIFYNVLLDCENYHKKTLIIKVFFYQKYLQLIIILNKIANIAR